MCGSRDLASSNQVHLDAPGVRGRVQAALHRLRDLLSLRQNLCQVLGPQYIPQRGGCQQLGRVTAEGVKLFLSLSYLQPPEV